MKKFVWLQDKIDPCCWFLRYKGEPAGCVCENGISASDGKALWLGETLAEKKRGLEKHAVIQEKLRRYEKLLWEKK